MRGAPYTLRIGSITLFGDKVISTVAHSDANGTLKVGDEGTVTGPSNNPSSTTASERVNCKFPQHASMNVRATTEMCRAGTPEARRYLPGATLAGGYRVGDKVISTIALSGANGTLKVGDEGTVAWPITNPSAADASERVNCKFPQHASANMLAATQLRRPR
jgi:hypothetical protein